MKYKKPMVMFLVFVLLAGLCACGKEPNSVPLDEKTFPTYEMITDAEKRARYEETAEIVRDLNEKSNFAGFALLEVDEESTRNGEDAVRESPGEEVIVRINEYPYQSGLFCVKRVVLKDKSVNVYGIRLGGNYATAEKVLREEGYERVYDPDRLLDKNSQHEEYKKGNVYISFTYPVWRFFDYYFTGGIDYIRIAIN